MDKQGWKRDLIRYTSDHGLQGKKTKVLKLRTVGYGVATLLASIYLVWSIGSSKLLEVNAIQNSYEVKINNKTIEAARYKLEMENLPDAEMDLGQFSDISLKPDSSIRILAKVRYTVQPGDAQKNREFQFKLTPLEGKVKEAVIIPSHFILP